ncbi:hypothetical protein GCM10009792_11020 [Microcella alkalica]|uniref:Deaminase n=1 Tax=Microcella alkalica TaxID=355930 RepID=A0A839E5Y1_9MICO|nr:hypothetical protein [Microcella alkalica]MBA8847210.1 hypothetical protein [Microcella alkalica]
MVVRLDLNVSLDGVAMPADPSPEHPMGEDWGRLVVAYAATRTFRERVLHDASDEGPTGVDDRYAAAYFEAPIVLGRGCRLGDDLPRLEEGRTVTTEIAESGVIHVTIAG